MRQLLPYLGIPPDCFCEFCRRWYQFKNDWSMLNLLTNEATSINIVHQWCIFGPHKTSLLKNKSANVFYIESLRGKISENEASTAFVGHPSWLVSMKFFTSDINLGMNDPCWNWSPMGLFEETLLANDESIDLIIYTPWQNICEVYLYEVMEK